MSLIINADGEYLTGTGGTFSPSSFTEMSFGIWVKKGVALSTNYAYAAIAAALSNDSNAAALAHYWDKTDGYIWPGPSGRRANNKGNTNSTAWQFLLFTYKQGGDVKVYTGITGGSLTNELFDGNSTTDSFTAALTQIRIGHAMDSFLSGAWHSRSNLAHCCFWTKELTAAEAGELFNGGTAGAGKNPQAIQNANLTFYAPLTSDATVTVGGVSLSATGTLTYDGAENPNVDAYGGGSVDGSATGATLTGTSSLTAGGASGSASGTATGANLTGTSSISAGSATGNATGSFTTAAMENNSGAGLLASTSVAWTWYEGVIGTAPTSTTHGTGTTNGSGILTVAGLPTAAGFLLARTSDSSGVYYQSGTPA